MANEIYNSSWWGLPIKNGWGGIYYDFAYPSFIGNKYLERVELDGGVVESFDCLSESLSFLNIYNWEYYFRVVEDLGIVESLECVTI